MRARWKRKSSVGRGGKCESNPWRKGSWDG